MERNFRPQLNPAEDEAQLKQTEQEESPAVESQESEINIEAKRQELYRDFQVALEAYNKEKEDSGSESGQWGRTNDENLRNTSQAAAECLDILKKLIDTSENTKYLVIEKNSDGSFSIENSDIPIEVHMDGETGIVNGFTIQGQRHEVNAGTHKARKNLNTNQLTVFRFIYSPEVTVKPPAEVIGEPVSMPSEQSNYLGENGKNTADFILGHIDTVNSRNPEIEDDLEVEVNQDNEKVEQKFQVIQELIEKRTEYTALEDIEDDVDKAGKDQIQERKQQILQEMQSLGGANGILNLDIELFDVFDNQIQRNLERVGEAFSESDGEITQIQERLRQIDIAEAQEGFAYYKEYYFKQLQESFDAQSQLDSAKAEAELNSRLEREERIRPLIETAIDIIPIVIKLQTLKELQANSQNPSSYDVNIAITQMQLGEMLSKVKKAEKAMDLETILAEMDNQDARDAEMSELMNADDISSVLITLIDSVVDKKDKLLGVEKGEIQTAEKEARASIESTKEELRLPERSEGERQFEEKAGQVRQHLSAIYRNQLLSEVYAETLKTIQENQDRFEEEHLTDLKNIYQQEVETAQRAVDVAYKNLVDLNIVDSSEITNKEKFIDYVPDMPLSIVRELMNSIEPAGDIENQIGYFEMTMSIVDDERGRVQNEIRQAIEKVLRVESSESEGSSAIVLANQEEVIDGELIEPDQSQNTSVNAQKSEIDGLWDNDEEEILDASFEENEIEPNDQETAIVLANKVKEVGGELTSSLDQEISTEISNPRIEAINRELEGLYAEQGDNTTSLERQREIDDEIAKLKSERFDLKKQEVYQANIDRIREKQDNLKLLQAEIQRLTEHSDVEVSEDLKGLYPELERSDGLEGVQRIYTREFSNLTAFLAGLHLQDELRTIYRDLLQDSIDTYRNAEKDKDNKYIEGIKKLGKVWKKIPAPVKLGAGIGLGIASAGAGAFGAVGLGLIAMKFAGGSATYTALDSWAMDKFAQGKVKDVKKEIEEILDSTSRSSKIKSSDVVKLLSLASATKKVIGEGAITDDQIEQLVELAESTFIEQSQKENKLSSEGELEELNDKFQNDREIRRKGHSIETTIGGNEVIAVSEFRKKEQEKYKSLRNGKLLRRGGAAAVGFGMAFGPQLFNGVEAIGDAVTPDIDLGMAPNDGGDIGFMSPETSIDSEVSSSALDSEILANGKEIPQVGDAFNGNTFVSKGGDVEVGRIIEQLAFENPEDVTTFGPGSTVSGEIMRIMQENGEYVDPQIAADRAYDFLNSDIGRVQLYELVQANDVGSDKLAELGISSLEEMQNADLSYDEVMNLSKYMETGQLVGLEEVASGVDLEAYGIDSGPDLEAPILKSPGVEYQGYSGRITQIDDYRVLNQFTNPEKVMQDVNSLPADVETLPYNPSLQGLRLKERAQLIISEAMGVRLDQVDYNIANQLVEDYFLAPDNTQGISNLYELVMNVPEGSIPAAEATELNLLQDTFEQLGENPTPQEMQAALKEAYGSTSLQRMTKINAVLSQIGKATNSSVQLPGLRESIGKAIVTRMTS